MKKTFKVVMLSTEKTSKIHFCPWDESEQLMILEEQKTIIGDHIAQHLYILSNEEIKEGDWFIHDNKLFQCGFIAKYINAKGNRGINICDDSKQQAFEKDNCKKIVATTDTSLRTPIEILTTIGEAITDISLPQLPEGFIQAYIKAYNEDKPITEVDLEMETSQTRLKQHNNRLGYVADCGVSLSKIIKTRPDNTVIVHQSKLYSKKEVEQKIRRAINDIFGKLVGLPQTSINKWIEENL